MINYLGQGKITRDAATLRAMLGIRGSGISENLNLIIRMPSGGEQSVHYAKTYAGLVSALASASSGDMIWIPACSITNTSGITVPAGVSLVGMSRAETILNMPVTLNNGANLENLAVINSGGIAVTCNGEAGIYSCYILGSTYAIWANQDIVYVEGGWIIGQTGGETESATPSYSWAALGSGIGKIEESTLVNGNFKLVGYDDSAWSTPYAAYSSYGTGLQVQGLPDTVKWIADPDNEGGGHGLSLTYRHEFEITGPVSAASLQIRVNDKLHGVWINGEQVVEYYNFYEWFGWSYNPPGIKHDARTYEINPGVFVQGTNCIAIVFQDQVSQQDPEIVEDDPGVELSYRLDIAYGGSAAIVTSGVRMDVPIGEPAQGDRSAWDAEVYPDRHANDIDDVNGIHHTIGTSAGQVAAGDHVHAEFDANLILTDDNGAILVDDNGNVLLGG